MLGSLSSNFGLGVLLRARDQIAPAARSARQSLQQLKTTAKGTAADVEKQAERMGKAYDAASRGMRSALKVAAIGAASLLPLIASTKTAADFEQAMTNVRAISGATGQELANLTTTARQLGATTMFRASQVAEGQRFLAMAGFTAKEINNSIRDVLNMTAAAGDIGLGRAADIASDISSAFGIAASDMSQVADVLTATFTTSNTTLEMLGESMKFVGPVARQAGVSLQQTAAMAGLLGNVGIKASQAGTTIRAMLLALAGPRRFGIRAMKEIGLEAKDAAGNLKPITTILADVSQRVERLGSAERLRILTRIFGREPAAGVAELIDQAGSGAIRAYAKQLENAGGTAARIAAIQMDTLKGSILELQSAAEGAEISFGTLFIPAVRMLVGILRSAANAVNFVSTHMPILAGVLGAVIPLVVFLGGTILSLIFMLRMWQTSAALAALAQQEVGVMAMLTQARLASLAVAKQLLTVVTAVWSRTTAIAASTGLWFARVLHLQKLATIAYSVATRIATVAQWALNAAMTANPIGIVIAVIVALIAAITILIIKVTAVRTFFRAVFEGIRDIVMSVVHGVVAAWDWMVRKWHEAINALVDFPPFKLLIQSIQLMVDGIIALRAVLRGESITAALQARGPLPAISATGAAVAGAVGIPVRNVGQIVRPVRTERQTTFERETVLQQRRDRDASRQQPIIHDHRVSRTQIVVNPPAGASPREIAENVKKIEQDEHRKSPDGVY